MQKADGMNYAPVASGKTEIVCEPGEFRFSVIGLDHGHIFAICNGLLEAGAELVSVWDPNSEKCRDFQKRYPQARLAVSEEEILADSGIQMVASAIRP
ncbi:MAG: gfo/Idh/MocA family oxidoreductase, partial [Clostridium sp.]|nr:gfo/Idh/MocA family oxidoreductase [Clostridium sp.]